MVTSAPPPSHRFSIALKLALVSWAVTIVTLLIFVAVIVPEQKRTFQANLSSKARGLSASLQDVIAGAAVTEDYSSVVDHCRQVLEGDDSIAYIVITKNDGFSLLHEPAPAAGPSAPRAEPLWRQQWLGEFWHPALRRPASGIARVPVFDRRVFYYSTPFDYSGIEWGWVNVGLSVRAYDQSVEAVYARTGILAVACIAFSLIVSVLYARRLVRPIKALQAVQQRVSQGDLAARAVIHTRDEVETLADSFNAMTGTLQQRDRILECVRLAAQTFLASPRWDDALQDILAKLGQAAHAWRIDVFTVRAGAGRRVAEHRFEWESAMAAGTGDSGTGHWIDGGIQGPVEDAPGRAMTAGPPELLEPGLRALLEPLRLASLVLTPVIVAGDWWGIICMGECRKVRQWTDPERDSLQAVADMLGATIVRHRAQDELLEAKDTLEQRVLERTNELREQMAAKEKAHAELAEVQHRLIELSRQAGMAEVATGVLHNVGNVLNSVNVSTTLIQERIRRSEVSSLMDLSRLLRQHEADFASFLSSDPRGRQVLPFIFQLADQLQSENRLLQQEQDHLIRNIEHIKEIVRMQQGYATISGVLEPHSVATIVDDAIRINAASIEQQGIRLVQEFADLPVLMLDKHKIIQILVNLLQNAKQALAESSLADRCLTIGIHRSEDQVEISFRDNGVGIPPENLTRIFSHGFSTRVGGHGFGLHTGALAAEEMGGRLSASSDGVGLGSTFTLSLPMTPPNPEQARL